MALYPKIQSPCPYKNNLAAILDGDMCRVCKRQVFDLTNMSDGQRVAFVRGCKDEVCVTYRFPVRPLIAAAALAAITAAIPTAAAACGDASETEIIVTGGGIQDPAHVEFVKNPGDAAIPELAVIYEDNTPAEKPELQKATTAEPETTTTHKA